MGSDNKVVLPEHKAVLLAISLVVCAAEAMGILDGGMRMVIGGIAGIVVARLLPEWGQGEKIAYVCAVAILILPTGRAGAVAAVSLWTIPNLYGVFVMATELEKAVTKSIHQ